MIKSVFSITRLAISSRVFLCCLLVSFFFKAAAQPPQFKIQFYINQYTEEAVQQMITYKIPASVILAQAIFESRSGTSQLSKKTNNHFGIKCHLEWEGETFTKDDDTLNECFRKYKSVEESYDDHSLFLALRPRYAELFKLEITDYKGWCYGLKNAGYATYPTYAEELIRIIEQTHLYELDHCEKLNTEVTLKKTNPELMVSRYTPSGFPLGTYSKAGLLWIDESDVLIQSLDMIIEHMGDGSDIADK